MPWLLALAAALAQEPQPGPEVSVPEGAPEASASGDTGEPGATASPATVQPQGDGEAAGVERDDTIIVWGEGAIRDANERVVRAMEDLGYAVRARKDDGTIVFKPPATWKGRVALKEGMLDFRRPVVALWLQEPARETQYDAARTLDGQDAPQATGLRFVVLPSKRRLMAVEAKVLDGTRDEILAYRDVVQRTAGEDILYLLPARLDALWGEGVPLDGVSTLPTPASRREHALAFWASRADTPLGEQVRETVVKWLAEVVQQSDHPLTAAELTDAEDRAGRSLELQAP